VIPVGWCDCMSRYLSESKALFLHIPRTGGSWIERAFLRWGIGQVKRYDVADRYRPRKHTLLGYYRNQSLIDVEFVFSFVRHPVSYYESVWRWLTSAMDVRKKDFGNDKRPWSPNTEAYKWYRPKFTDWVELMLEHQPGWVTRLFELYIGPEKGEFCCYVGRMESLLDDFCEVMSLLGYDKQVDKNKGERIHYTNSVRCAVVPRVIWPEDLRQQVERTERLIIRRFYSEETMTDRFYAGLALSENQCVWGCSKRMQAMNEKLRQRD